MLSVRPTRKTYGRTASGKRITDDLIDALARKAEAGYEIKDTTNRPERLRRSAKRLRRADGLDCDALERIEELGEVREDVCRIAAAHGGCNIRLFGSTARGERDVSSDLDLLVDMAKGAGPCST